MEEDFDEISEKPQTYFDDFELNSDQPDPGISLQENQLLWTIEEVCKYYKIVKEKVVYFFLRKWRNYSWDAEFLRYDTAYPDPFEFWMHLNDYGTPGEKFVAPLLIRLLTVLASEASAERVFSQKRPMKIL